MANRSIAAALDIARARHDAIVGGDTDAFMADDERLRAACHALLGEVAEGLTALDIPQLDELIGLETQSRRILEQLMGEASQRMIELQRRGRANDAYTGHERISVNGR